MHNEDKKGVRRRTKHTVLNCGRFQKSNGAVRSGSWDVYTVDIAVGQTGIIMAEDERKKEAARIHGDLAQVS
jgi:hypothetical protein